MPSTDLYRDVAAFFAVAARQDADLLPLANRYVEKALDFGLAPRMLRDGPTFQTIQRSPAIKEILAKPRPAVQPSRGGVRRRSTLDSLPSICFRRPPRPDARPACTPTPQRENMSTLGTLYKASLGLLTDLYQLTMAYGYWKTGRHDQEAVFHLFFRKHPFGGGFTVAAGLATVVEYLEGLRFDPEDLAYLAGLQGTTIGRCSSRRFSTIWARCALRATSTASPRERSSFPTSRCCG